MYETVLQKKTVLPIVVIVMILGMTCPVSAMVYYFWTGAVSTDVTDPNNWVNDNLTLTVPGWSDVALVGVDSSWQLFVPTNQPVLTSVWIDEHNDPNAGWWIINGAGGQNSLTIGDGAYIKSNYSNTTLRNDAVLRITGRSRDDGPSMVITPRFHIGHNGDSMPDSTPTLIIEDDGYLCFDQAIATKGNVGNEIFLGGEANALIEIRDDGILETRSGIPGHSDESGVLTPQFVFASSDPNINKVVISGNGQLLLAGDPVSGLVEEEETSLEDMIAQGLIASGEEGVDLIIRGTNPTVVKVAGERIGNPQPADGKTDTDRQVTLSWDPGTLTDKYDVYFGTDLTSVSEATRDNPLDALKSQGQTETTYPVDGPLSLVHGQTCYWRVDEVEVPPAQTILKGKVWSFRIEPYAIPILSQDISVTASSESPDQGPEKTIDRSGLDPNDPNGLHSNVLTDMWLSEAEEPNSAWIQYEFDKPYKLHQMLVWNYNGQDILTGLGLKDVAIEYSTDGADQVSLGVFEFAQASGAADYAHNPAVPFNGIPVQRIKITAHTNWANNPIFNKYGLSEVMFLHVPVSAREPSPATGATDVAPDETLTWRAGREAVEHKVYLNTDEQAVTEGTAPFKPVTQAAYSPSLQLDTIYYWRVDEVNDAMVPSVWPGSTWSFTTVEMIVVDDFEDYDDTCNRIYWAWIDGGGFSYDPGCPNFEAKEGNGSGATVGNYPAPFAEQTIVYSGFQSMPLDYDNSGAASSSQTDRTLPSDLQDWMQFGITTLVIHFYGTAGNTGQLYVKIGNNTPIQYPGDAADIAAEAWIPWEIDLIDLAANGAALENVSTLSIRIDGADASGLLYIDDIWLK